MDDYPNDGAVFDPTMEPEERVEAEREEERKAKVDAKPIEQLIDHLNTRIKLNGDIKSYGITEKTPIDEIKAIMLSHTLLDELLEQEKDELDTLRRTYS